MGLDPKKILSGTDADEIILLLRQGFESGPEKIPSVEISAGVLAAVYPDQLVPKLVDIFESTIDRKEVHVSDVDYEIFLTHDGVVHDKAVLEAIQQQGANEAKNVKRENKAYSYKEQVGHERSLFSFP